MKKTHLLGVAVVALLAIPLVIALGAVAGERGEPGPVDDANLETRTVTPQGNWQLTDARAFAAFPLYTVGDSFQGLRLNAVMRVNAKPYPGEPVRADHVTFLYGTCESYGGQGCTLPLQVQVWNACERNSGSYELGPGGPAIDADERLSLRGVPAAFYEDYSRLELYSGLGTIVLFAGYGDRELLHEAATALRGLNVQAPVGVRLPALGPDAKPLRCT
jgi:hypothetical protein